MPSYMKMSQNINKTMRHLKFCYISILTNLLRTICKKICKNRNIMCILCIVVVYK